MFGFMDYLPMSSTCALAAVATAGLLWWIGSFYLHKKDQKAVAARTAQVETLRNECVKLEATTEVLREASDSWNDSWVDCCPVAQPEETVYQPVSKEDHSGEAEG